MYLRFAQKVSGLKLLHVLFPGPEHHSFWDQERCNQLPLLTHTTEQRAGDYLPVRNHTVFIIYSTIQGALYKMPDSLTDSLT